MWEYQKMLQHPIKVKNPDAKAAKVIMSQLGGPNGELGASTRYLNQRYTMPYDKVKAMLTDIGTEELGHAEMVATLIHQLTRNLTVDEIKAGGYDTYFVDHTVGAFPQSAGGTPFSTATLQVTGDPIADLMEDLAAEQKARLSYDNILRLVDDPDVRNVIKFLRERELVHFQRFGDSLGVVQDNLNSKNFYAFNPGFDRPQGNMPGGMPGTRPGRPNGRPGAMPGPGPMPGPGMMPGPGQMPGPGMMPDNRPNGRPGSRPEDMPDNWLDRPGTSPGTLPGTLPGKKRY